MNSLSKNLSFILLCLVLPSLAVSQEVIVQLDKSFGSPDAYDGAHNAFQNSQGDYFVFGSSKLLSTNNTNELFLLKTDEFGNELWSRSYNSNDNSIIDYHTQTSAVVPDSFRSTELSAYVYGEQMLIDDNENLVMAGISAYTVNSSVDARGFPYVVKTDQNGTIIWEKVFVGDAVWKMVESINKVDGGYLVTGLSTHGGNTAAWLKLDEDGNVLWQKTIDAFPTGGGLAFGQLSFEIDSGIIYGFAFSTNGAMYDTHLVEINPDNGATIQERVLRNEGFNFWVFDMKKVSDGYMLVGTDWENYQNTVVAKLDNNGELLWTQSYDSSRAFSIAESLDGTYYLPGFSNDENGIAKLSILNINPSDGQFNFNETFDYQYRGIGYSIENTEDGGLLVTYLVDEQLSSGDFTFIKTIGIDTSGTIKGQAYIDTNFNCTLDDQDNVIANRLIQAVGQDGGVYQVATDDDGYYELKVEAGDYMVSPTFLLRGGDKFLIDEDCVTLNEEITVNKGEITEGINFALLCPVCPPDGISCLLDLVDEIGSGECDSAGGGTGIYVTPCPGETFKYVISVVNDGIGPAMVSDLGPIEISLPDYIENSVIVTSTQDTAVTFVEQFSVFGVTINPSDLVINAGANVEYCISLTIALDNQGPYQFFIDDTDCGGLSPDPIEAECSCDPNDMAVSPQGCGEFGNIEQDQRLRYKVRFENIGPGFARDVVITNILDDDLDITSIELLSSSHDVTRFQLNPGNELVVSFEDIELDPVQNTPLNQGYFTYSILPKPNLPEGTIITNQASIVFDSNEPVITNEVVNTVYTDVSVEASFDFEKQCDSYGFNFDFQYTGATEGATYYWDFGANATPQSSTQENPSGITFSEGTNDVTLTVTKNGCDEIATQSIEVSDVGTVDENTTLVCLGGWTIRVHNIFLDWLLNFGFCIGPCDDNRDYSDEVRKLPNALTYEPILEHGSEINEDFTLFPNPASTHVNINVNSEDYNKLEVKDMSGRLVIRQELVNNKTRLDVKNLIKGVYFISLASKTKEKVLVKKFIKF